MSKVANTVIIACLCSAVHNSFEWRESWFDHEAFSHNGRSEDNQRSTGFISFTLLYIPYQNLKLKPWLQLLQVVFFFGLFPRPSVYLGPGFNLDNGERRICRCGNG